MIFQVDSAPFAFEAIDVSYENMQIGLVWSATVFGYVTNG